MTLGLAVTTRVVAAAAVPALFLSASQCSTAFVLRSSLGSSSDRTAATTMRSATTSTLSRGAQRTRGTPLLSLGALRTSDYRERGVRLMMAAEPAEDSVAEAAAAAAAAAEEPSISEGEGA
ncbi:unnamed protein product, partial [Ectocarpus sp. 8 AP-2014]